MKKLIAIFSLLLLAGCSEPMNTVSESMPLGDIKQEKEIMKQTVHVYSLKQNSQGTIFKWDNRDKWAIVPASVVVSHPKALIETSTGQLLEGTITSLNADLNIAIVHFRNSAVLEQKKLDKDTISNAFSTFNDENEEVKLSAAQLDEILSIKTKTGVPFDERTEARNKLQNYPILIQAEENKIETYEKETFIFDRDAVQLKMNEFIEQYNSYVNKKENILLSMIANDDVKQVFLDWEVYGEAYTFFEPEVTSISFEGFLYRGIFKAKMGKEKPQDVQVAVAFMKENETYRIVTFAISEM